MISAGQQRVFAEGKGTWCAVERAIHLALWQRPFWDDSGVVVQLLVHFFYTGNILSAGVFPALPPLSVHVQANTLGQEAPLSHMPICSKPVPFEQWVCSLTNHEHTSISMTCLLQREEKGIKRAVKHNKERKRGEKRRQRQIQREGRGKNLKFN